MLTTHDRVLEALNKVMEDEGMLTVNDILDEDDNVVGKFYLSYSDDNHPYIISIQDDTLRVFDVYRWYTLIVMSKSESVYTFQVNIVDVPKTLLIKLFGKVSKLVTN